MKLEWCLVALAVALLPRADGQLADELPADHQENQYANRENNDQPTRVTGAFNRAAVEHRPDADEIRRFQSQYTRLEALDLVLEEGFDGYQSDAGVQYQIEEEETYPDSYQGFNGHSYQYSGQPVLNQLELLVDPVPIDPSSVTKNGKMLRHTRPRLNFKQETKKKKRVLIEKIGPRGFFSVTFTEVFELNE